MPTEQPPDYFAPPISNKPSNTAVRHEQPHAAPQITNQPVTNYPVPPQYNINPIQGGYVVQNITVPYDRQTMFNDDVIMDILPAQGRQAVAVVTPADRYPTQCTSRNPQVFYCTNCNKVLCSRIKVKHNYLKLLLWILVIAVLIVFLLFIFIWFPFRWKKVVHYCPKCERKVGESIF